MGIKNKNKTEIQNLLPELLGLNQIIQKDKDQKAFNLFSILRRVSEEVNLHSKFIYSLLSKDINPLYSQEFLTELLKTLKIQFGSEERFSVFREYKDIDIYIKSSQQAIIIENKIWAGDQEGQLVKYYNHALNEKYKPEQIKVFYLSPHGKSPNEISLITRSNWNFSKDKLCFKDLEIISYENHISNWLEACLSLCRDSSILTQSLLQYLGILNQITGRTMDKEYIKEVFDILSKGQNLELAAIIGNSWDQIKTYTESQFWTHLEIKLNKKCLLPNSKHINRWTTGLIEQTLRTKDNSKKWFGLMYTVMPEKQKYIDGADVTIYIERSPWNLVFGVSSMGKDGNRKKSMISRGLLDKLNEEFKDDFDVKDKDAWLGFSDFYPSINFQSFEEKTTLQLANPQKLNEIIDSILEQCNQLESRVEDVISNYES